MPQMAPLLWLVLFIYFVGLFILMMVIMYYFTFMSTELNTSRSGISSHKSLNWNW